MSNEKHSIAIGIEGSRAKISIDGIAVPQVRKYTIEHRAGQAPTVTLELAGVDVSVNGDGFVKFDTEVEGFIKGIARTADTDTSNS